MIRHTPGPWEVQPIADEGDERGQAFIVGVDRGGLVGAALPWPTEYDSGDFSRVLANARLIATAPDLLEALTEARRYLDAVVANSGSSKRRENYAGAVRRIDAVVAKAAPDEVGEQGIAARR